MKKLLPAVALCLLFVISLIPIASPFTAKASPSASFDVNAEHVVDIRESGLLVINDTVTLSTNAGDIVEPLQSYRLGFPFTYQSDLAYAFAYETANRSRSLDLDLNAGIGRIGFYGVRVNFLSPIDISNSGSYRFTVVYVFSDSISFKASTFEGVNVVNYNASFPAYPSLPQTASRVNLKIVLPQNFNLTQSSFEKDGISFTNTTEDSRHVFSYVKNNLSEFSDQSAWVDAFKKSGETQLLDVAEVDRKINLSGNQLIMVSESYKLANKLGDSSKIQLMLPKDAYSISAFDEFGMVPEQNVKTQSTDKFTNVSVTFTLPHKERDEIHVALQYNLPWQNHVASGDFGEFHFSLSLFENFDWTIRRFTATVTLPEGATFHSPRVTQSLSTVETAAFSSSFVFAVQNATPFHDLSMELAYKRPVLWESFRPTVWMGTAVLAICALVGAWQFYRPSPTVQLPTTMVRVHAEELRSFISYYDERARLTREVGSLETAARKGKIPRRQYKVRKTTIDSRLASLSRDLAALRNKLRAAGPRYAELMRQLEIAENELQGATAEISRAEAGYRRGDLSAQAYHNVLETAYGRRNRAQTTIDGALLRLKEEIS